MCWKLSSFLLSAINCCNHCHLAPSVCVCVCVWGGGEGGSLPMFGYMGISFYGISSIMHVTQDKDTRQTNAICSVNAHYLE